MTEKVNKQTQKEEREKERRREQQNKEQIIIDNLIILKLAFILTKGKTLNDLYALIDTTHLRYTNTISELGEPKAARISGASYIYLLDRVKISTQILDGTKRFDIGLDEGFWKNLRDERKIKAKKYQNIQYDISEADDEKLHGKYYKQLKEQIKKLLNNPERCNCLDFKKVIAYVREDSYKAFEKLMIDNLSSQINKWLKLSMVDLTSMNYEQLSRLYNDNEILQKRIAGILAFRENN